MRCRGSTRRAGRSSWRQMTGTFYRNYLQIFRNYLLRAKDPVPHPLWQQGE